MKVLCFHGFLGRPSDYDFLVDSRKIQKVDFDPFVELTVAEIFKKLNLAEQGNHLVGYSFGSRFVIQLFLYRPEAFESVTLLAGHAGIKSADERQKRIEIEKEVMQKVRTLPEKEFFEYWNSLGLFKADKPLTRRELKRDLLIRYIENWRLSEQPYLKDELLRYKEKVRWFFGELDPKYADYARAELGDFDVQILSGQGHRMLQNRELQEYLKEIFI